MALDIDNQDSGLGAAPPNTDNINTLLFQYNKNLKSLHKACTYIY